MLVTAVTNCFSNSNIAAMLVTVSTVSATMVEQSIADVWGYRTGLTQEATRTLRCHKPTSNEQSRVMYLYQMDCLGALQHSIFEPNREFLLHLHEKQRV
jgi:hypothetical protein